MFESGVHNEGNTLSQGVVIVNKNIEESEEIHGFIFLSRILSCIYMLDFLSVIQTVHIEGKTVDWTSSRLEYLSLPVT